MLRTLEIKPSGDTDIVAIRTLPASRERVFQALTMPALLQHWHLGPEGWQLPVCNINLQVGKPYRFVWRREGEPDLGNGGQIAFAMLPTASNTTALTHQCSHDRLCYAGVYKEIDPPSRLVHTEAFDGYPGESLVTTNLEEHDGSTVMHVTMQYDSKGTRDAVLATGMELGMAASYDRLDKLLQALNRQGSV
jgi:uncharacterized protein YndB with AHSA1/START domain